MTDDQTAIEYEPFNQRGEFQMPPDSWASRQTAEVTAAVARIRVCTEALESAEQDLRDCEADLKQAVKDRTDAIYVMEHRFKPMTQYQLWQEAFGRKN